MSELRFVAVRVSKNFGQASSTINLTLRHEPMGWVENLTVKARRAKRA